MILEWWVKSNHSLEIDYLACSMLSTRRMQTRYLLIFKQVSPNILPLHGLRKFKVPMWWAVHLFFLSAISVLQVIKALIDLEALQPTGDLSPVCIYASSWTEKALKKWHLTYIFCLLFFDMQVRRSVQFFLDNLLSQSPDQQQTLAAIGEVSWPYSFARFSLNVYN
jgi:hypothetical protein